MARTKSQAVAKRNDVIFAEWRRGATLTGLAEKHGISRQVVGRIVASFHPELEEDTDRALYRGELWRLYDEVGEVFQNPGHKMSPTGHFAEGPDGEPAVDVDAKIKAGDLRLKVLTELRKLDGRDKQVQKQMDTPAAEAAMWVALAAEREKREAQERRMAEYARQVTAAGHVIPGEVVAELPPGT